MTIKKTISLVSRYVKEFPNNADYLNKLGVLYANENNYKEAEKWYLKAIENGKLDSNFKIWQIIILN